VLLSSSFVHICLLPIILMCNIRRIKVSTYSIHVALHNALHGVVLLKKAANEAYFNLITCVCVLHVCVWCNANLTTMTNVSVHASMTTFNPLCCRQGQRYRTNVSPSTMIQKPHNLTYALASILQQSIEHQT